MKKNIVIVASGLATRLMSIHQNQYPKILLNYGQKNLLMMMLDQYDGFFNSISIILPSKRAIEQCKAVIALSEYDTEVNFVLHEKANGTYQTILDCKDKLPNDNVLFSWSDIVFTPNKEIFKQEQNCSIITDSNIKHRSNFNGYDLYLTNDSTGNVPGLFCIRDVQKFFKHSKDYSNSKMFECLGNDLVSYIRYRMRAGEKIGELKSLSVKDFGTIDTYYDELSKLTGTTRYYNTLTEISGAKLSKHAKTESARQIMKHELNFYNEHKEFANDLFPAIYEQEPDHSGFVMQKIEGSTIKDYIATKDKAFSNPFIAIGLYESFKLNLEPLHKKPVTIDVDQSVLFSEYVTATQKRIKDVQPFLPEIATVNSSPVLSVDSILGFVSEYIDRKLYQPEYTYIHGDTNLTNVMLTKDQRMMFIDPRGRFSNLSLIGDKNYDYMKFLFGLSGFDTFDSEVDILFAYNPETKAIDVNYYGYDIDCVLHENNLNDQMLKLLVGLSWMRFGPFTINNINKIIVSYSIGLIYATEAIERIQEIRKILR